VRIHAVALNARDIMVLSHSPAYPVPTSPGLTPCSDGAGIVTAVGADSVWAVGDRVLLHTNAWVEGSDVRDFDLQSVCGGGDVQGTLMQCKVVRDEVLLRMPGNLGFEEAACLPTAGGTAVNALLFGPVAVGPGMVVLVQGTGGVSVAALQVRFFLSLALISGSTSGEHKGWGVDG